jgi:hypothetical protein
MGKEKKGRKDKHQYVSADLAKALENVHDIDQRKQVIAMSINALRPKDVQA